MAGFENQQQSFDGTWPEQTFPMQNADSKWVQVKISESSSMAHSGAVQTGSPIPVEGGQAVLRVEDDDEVIEIDREPPPYQGPRRGALTADGASDISELIDSRPVPLQIRRRGQQVRFGGAEYFDNHRGEHYHYVPLTIRVPIFEFNMGAYELSVVSQPRPNRNSIATITDEPVQYLWPRGRYLLLLSWFVVFGLLLGLSIYGIRGLYRFFSRLP